MKLLVGRTVERAQFSLDKVGRVVDWNGRAERLLGYTAADTLGAHMSVFYPDDDESWDDPDRGLNYAVEQGRYEQERWLIRNDDTRLLADVTIIARHGDNGALLGFSVLFRDRRGRRGGREQLLALLESAADAVIGADHEGRILLVNRAAEELFGYEERQLVGHPLTRVLPALARQARLDGGRIELDGIGKSGKLFPAKASLASVGADREHLTAVTVSDRSERLALDARMRDYEERVRVSFDHALIGEAIVGLDGRFRQVNPALSQLMGYPAEALLGMHALDIAHPEDVDNDGESVRRLLAGDAAAFSSERRYVRRDGRVIWVRHHATLVRDRRSGAPRYLLLQFQDITEQRVAHQQFELAQDRLAHQATHDDLTGLPNRVQLLDRFEAALARAEKSGQTPAVLFLDVDHFKWINDTLGHSAGDQLLVTVADRIQAALRPRDVVARFGGDEFVVLLESTPSAAAAQEVAERIRDAVRQPVAITGRTVRVTCSVGVSVSTEPSWGTLLQEADTALSEAKARGRDRSERFESTMRAAVGRRMDAEELIQDALRDGRVHLQYQPIVDLTTGQVVSTEALARIRDVDGELIPPGRFIDVAEETGLILPLGDVVMDRACAQRALWRRDERAGFVAVNVAAQQLSTGALAARVNDALTFHGLEPRHLCLELTESTLIDAGTQMRRNISDLRELGVTLALDDFGTGWSSLSYLRRFPLDIVKIDRSFVAGVGVNEDDAAVVRAVVELGRSLKLTTVAEGVETEVQAARLRSLGCDRAQGFYYGRPVDPADVDFAARSGVEQRP